MPKTSESGQKRAFALIHDYKSAFGTPEGKRVLRSLMKMTGFLQTNHAPGDSHGTAYNEGARSIVIHILGQLRRDMRSLEKQLSEEVDATDEVSYL